MHLHDPLLHKSHFVQLLTLYPHLLTMVRRLENIVAKREDASNQHFLLFPQCLLPYKKTEIII